MMAPDVKLANLLLWKRIVKLLPRAVTCAALCLTGFLPTIVSAQPAEELQAAALVQGSDLEAVIAAVCAVGGEITHELGIIDSVSARLTPEQIRRLQEQDGALRIRADRTVEVNGPPRIATAVKTTSAELATPGPCAKHDPKDQRPSIDTEPAERSTGNSGETPQ